MAASHSIKTHDGAVFGAWVVLSQKDGNTVECVCECGTHRLIHRSNLTSGKTKSCGCKKAEKVAKARTTHSMFGTPTYSSWSSMMTRCKNQKSKSYANYGARGIKVCERWNLFENFLQDMGEKPKKGMSIERINNDGNYEPGNCRWATPKEQASNTRRTKLTQELVSQIRAGQVSKEEVMHQTGCASSTYSMAKLGTNWK